MLKTLILDTFAGENAIKPMDFQLLGGRGAEGGREENGWGSFEASNFFGIFGGRWEVLKSFSPPVGVGLLDFKEKSTPPHSSSFSSLLLVSQNDSECQ